MAESFPANPHNSPDPTVPSVSGEGPVEDAPSPREESTDNPQSEESLDVEQALNSMDDSSGVEETESSNAEGTGGEAAIQNPTEPESEEEKKDWYILKVQSNREESIKQGLLRRIAVAGLDDYFGEIIVPIEKVTEFKGGRKRVVKRKLYPGYIVVHMCLNDDTWFLVRETPGIGDFTGAGGKPTPMLPHEVQRIVSTQEEKPDEAPKLKIAFRPGDRVKINEGTFDNFEGEVEAIDESNGRVTIMINIFGRSTPVELEYWQVESI